MEVPTNAPFMYFERLSKFIIFVYAVSHEDKKI